MIDKKLLSILVCPVTKAPLEYDQEKDELVKFLRIVDALPDHELPDIPPVFAPPADWTRLPAAVPRS